MTKCGIVGCENEGVVYPVFVVWPVGADRAIHSPSRLVISLATCSACAPEIAPRDVLGDEGWQNIRASYLTSMLAEPDRESVELEFTPIAPADEAFAALRECRKDSEVH